MRGGRAVARSVTMLTEFDPHALIAEARLGVLATIKSDGRPQLSPVTPFYDREAGVLGTDPDGPEVQALVDYYRAAAGEHPDWAEYRAVMVADRRVLMAMRVERAYGAKVR